MRFRVSGEQVEYYQRSKRDGTPVRFQGRDWRVQGVTVDMMGGVATKDLSDTSKGGRPQWWVELTEA